MHVQHFQKCCTYIYILEGEGTAFPACDETGEPAMSACGMSQRESESQRDSERDRDSESERQRDRESERQRVSESQRDRESERQRDRQAGRHTVDAGPVGFDVGANIGVFTVPMARVARAHRGRVVAIEADAANHALLRTNIALNRPAADDLGGREGQATVTLLHAAAGATPRPSVHMQPRDSPATSSLRQRLGNFGSP